MSVHWIHPVFALLVALLFGAVLVGALGWRHPRRADAGASMLFLMLLLFPLLWVAALWSAPIGPTLFGAALVPPLLLGVLLALVIAILAMPGPTSTAGGVTEAGATASVFGAMFWVLLLVAAGAVAFRYLV